MENLINLEKKINSELTTKINSSKIKHNQIYLLIDSDDIIDVILFLKTNTNTKFRQLIDITAVDFEDGEIIWQTPTQVMGFGKNITLRNSDLVSDGNFIYMSNNKK